MNNSNLDQEYMLLNGLAQQYKQLYEYSIDNAKEYLFFRPMTQENADILMSGNIHVDPEVPDRLMLDPQGQHLACFAGGMVGLGSRVFNRPDDLPIARKLTEGCIWAYRAMPTGIMPERFYVFPCANATDCLWDAEVYFQYPS
jgi:mannosyl-oligosaccharide alpha-1,2-mannosidase